MGVERAGGTAPPPGPLTAEELSRRSELYLAGTATSLQVGDTLLFVFGADGAESDGAGAAAPGRRGRDRSAAAGARRAAADRPGGGGHGGRAAAVAPPSLGELREELRRWIAEPEGDPDDAGEEPATPEHPGPRPVSMLISTFDTQVLAPLRADLDGLTTPAAFVARLAGPHERLTEAMALAAPYEAVAAWFERLAAVVAELADRARSWSPRGRNPERETRAEAGRETGAEAGVEALPGTAAGAPRCAPWAPCCPRCARTPGTPGGSSRPGGRSPRARTSPRASWPPWTGGWPGSCTRRGGGPPSPRPLPARRPACCARCCRCG
ncbi:hypothetical protein NKH77_40060 [Streptomyces sp. M19]